MKRILFGLLVLSAVLCACNRPSSGNEESSQNSTTDEMDQNIIHRLPVLHVEDTVRSGNNVYAWTINREPCDSLGIVTDEMGFRFADNVLTVTVKKNGSAFFSKTFRKTSFSHFLDEDFARQSILDGCRFMQVHEGMVTFSLAVSYPRATCPSLSA